MVTLEASKLFRHLSPAELNAVRMVAREQRFAAGQEIFKEGDNGDGVYVVNEGVVEISVRVAPESRLVLSEIGAGDFFGEMAVVDFKPRSACAVAKAATLLSFIPRAEMLSLIDRSPALSLSLLREISNRLRDFNQLYLREVLQTERLAIVGRFARSIVHDLKNPLNIIGLTAEMAGMPQIAPEVRQQAASRIRKQVDRINDLIGEILDFTQGAQGAFVLAPADYIAFVRQMVEELAPEAALKSATLELIASSEAIELAIHPKRLRRVFANLVHNAIEAMPDGGQIRLRIRVEPKEVVTEIEDFGAGIPPEVADQLFQVFVTHGKAHGTGLGLSICKRIIEDHRGWISARNKSDCGAVFAFGLPRPEMPAS